LEDPDIAAAAAVSGAGSLVDHLPSDGDDGRFAGHVDLLVVLAEFEDLRVLAEIAESGKELVPALDPPGKAGKNHDDVPVHQGRRVLDLAGEPCLVNLPHGRRCGLVCGVASHELLLTCWTRTRWAISSIVAGAWICRAGRAQRGPPYDEMAVPQFPTILQ